MTDPGRDLVVPPGPGLRRGLVIPAGELVERFSRSSGPGGQGVNTTDSRVELVYDISASHALSTAQRTRLLEALGTRLVEGHLTIAASEYRSQLRNRAAARERLSALLRECLAPPVERRATRPTRGSKERRLASKKRRAQVKSGRGEVPRD